VLIAALLWIPSVLMLYVHRRRIYYDIAGIASAALAGLGVFALFGFAQLLWVMHWKPMPRQIIAQWQQSPQPPRNHPLLVWIIFDELAYKQIFEERPADLSVPNFDSLRGQSTLYTDVQPVAEETALAVPSLLSGAPVDAWKLDMQNRYSVHNSNGDWHPLNGSGTVFGDAQRNGWRTAAVGWYLPYCGLYADALNSCDWSFWDNYNGPVSLHNSFAANTLDPLRYLALEQISQKAAMQVFCAKDMARHADTAAELEPHWIQLLRGDQADFLFIHLGVPHPPNLWNRHDSAYTTVCGGSYIDSLSLADRTLGQILAILRSSPRWNQTTLIVDGDHSWRAPGWRGSTSWTPEDEIVSHHGEFDTRPAVIIHLPGQTQPQTNSSAWPLLRLHDVVEQTLRGQPVTY